MDDEYDPFRHTDSVQSWRPKTADGATAKKSGGWETARGHNVDYAPSRSYSDQDAATAPFAPASPSITRSISRSSRPCKLNLTKSNGSTAASISSLASSTHFSFSPAGARPSSSRSNTNLPPLPPAPVDRPLPPLPPPAVAKALPSLAMGNAASKSENDLTETGTRARAASQSVKRRPVGGGGTLRGAVEPPNDAVRKRLVSPKQALEGVRDRYSRHSRDVSAGQQHSLSDRAKASDPKSPQQLSPAPSRLLPPTPPNEDSPLDGSSAVSSTLLSQHEQLANAQKPSTPPLNSPQLPSPEHIVEDTPSKYGVTGPSSGEASDGDTHGMEHEKSKHFRGKSSTGLDIFKATAALQKAHTYLNTMSPPTSRPESPLSSPQSATSVNTISRHSMSQQTRSPAMSNSARSSAVEPFPAMRHSRPETGHYSITLNPHLSYSTSSSYVESIEPLISTDRPHMSSAPYLLVSQTHCLHQHRRWRLSRNMHAAIACSLCYSEKDELSSEDGAGERWSCIWCALRVCLPCRDKVELHMGRDPEKAVLGSEIPPPRQPRVVMMRSHGHGHVWPLAPPPNVFGGMGSPAGWHSTSDLVGGGRGSGMGSAMGSRRGSAGTMNGGSIPPMMPVDARGTPVPVPRRPQMGQMVIVDDDATPRKGHAFGPASRPSIDGESMYDGMERTSFPRRVSPPG